MFNFSRIKKAFEPTKDPQVLIAEIHNEFDTATERLLNEAQVILSSGDKEKQSKAERLKSIGFIQSKTVAETALQIKEEKESKDVADAIMYYQQWYPNNKFITEKEVEKICKKYSLVCGEVEYYKGDVPEKNLQEIESFKLRDEEKNEYYPFRQQQFFAAQSQGIMGLGGFSDRPRYNPPSYTEEQINKKEYYAAALKICAPLKDFDRSRMEVKDSYKLQHIPDPIVLQPVKKGYLIISKWGLEGQDESLVNEKMN